MHFPLALFLSVCVSFTRAELKDIPQTAIANGSFGTLVAVLTKANLVATLSGDGPFTVFAPTDDAFAKVDAGVLKCLQEDAYKTELAAVLTYHVANGKVLSSDLLNDQKIPTLETSEVTVTIDGSTVKVNEATVISPDVEATNGIIHAIDEVLIPTDNAGVAALIETCKLKDIPQTAIANGSFGTLVAVLTSANLVATLSGDGPFTVFAPTDDAFAKVDAGVLKCLQETKYVDALTAVLTYHVASGKVLSTALQNDQKIPTLETSEVTVTIDGSTVKVNKATVIIPDVETTNGIIHAIDEVLIPTDNADVDALIAACAPAKDTSASAILGVAIPLIGMLAAVAVIV